jgi:hypothetical protein
VTNMRRKTTDYYWILVFYGCFGVLGRYVFPGFRSTSLADRENLLKNIEQTNGIVKLLEVNGIVLDVGSASGRGWGGGGSSQGGINIIEAIRSGLSNSFSGDLSAETARLIWLFFCDFLQTAISIPVLVSVLLK